MAEQKPRRRLAKRGLQVRPQSRDAPPVVRQNDILDGHDASPRRPPAARCYPSNGCCGSRSRRKWAMRVTSCASPMASAAWRRPVQTAQERPVGLVLPAQLLRAVPSRGASAVESPVVAGAEKGVRRNDVIGNRQLAERRPGAQRGGILRRNGVQPLTTGGRLDLARLQRRDSLRGAFAAVAGGRRTTPKRAARRVCRSPSQPPVQGKRIQERGARLRVSTSVRTSARVSSW